MTTPGVREGRTALAYLRVSTDEQDAGLDAQRATIAAEAAKRGLELVAEYVDHGISGTTPPKDRPALSAALSQLADARADRLIVAKLDRLARSTIDALALDDAARSQGWATVFGDLDIDTGTAAGKLVLTNFAALAQFERDRIAERTREALAVKRAQGVRLGRPSVLPAGIVARIVAERQAGSSLRAIANGLTRDGIPTARGGDRWQVSAIQAVLRGQQADAALKSVATQQEPDPLEGEAMYGVWQTGELFRYGQQPWAVSEKQSNLLDWTLDNIPQEGLKHFCFAEKIGSLQDLADANWKLTGHYYKKHGIKMLNINPEKYVRERARAIENGCPGLTEEDLARPTVNVDTKTQPGQGK